MNVILLLLISGIYFNNNSDSNLYKKQIIDLLYDEGLLFLTMCNDRCKGNHSTSPSNYKDFVDQKIYSKMCICFSCDGRLIVLL